jgi:hypothetical protein
VTGKELLGALLAQTAGEERVVVVLLAVPLVAGEADLVGVDDHHEVAGVGVGGERGPVLAAQDGGDARGGPAERLA